MVICPDERISLIFRNFVISHLSQHFQAAEHFDPRLAFVVEFILIGQNRLCPCSAAEQRRSPKNDPVDPCKGNEEWNLQNPWVIPRQPLFSRKQRREPKAVVPVQHIEPILQIAFLLQKQLTVVLIPARFSGVLRVFSQPAAFFQIIQNERNAVIITVADAGKIIRSKAAVLNHSPQERIDQRTVVQRVQNKPKPIHVHVIPVF